MEVISLQSGSSGNCVFVRVGETRLLFDVGISGRKTQSRLAERGHDLHQVDAVVISHDHSDHTSAMGPINRRFDLPLYLSRPTYQVVSKKRVTGALSQVNHFRSGEVIEFPEVRVQTIRTPHDAVDGVCFVIEDTRRGTRFGLMTDLGHCFDGLSDWLADLDALMIESNYDLTMLREGFYARHLKERIHGQGGHLSNEDAARMIRNHTTERLQWVCLAHLSDENNTPELAIETCRKHVRKDLAVHCAERHDAIDPLRIDPPAGGVTPKPGGKRFRKAVPMRLFQ